MNCSQTTSMVPLCYSFDFVNTFKYIVYIIYIFIKYIQVYIAEYNKNTIYPINKHIWHTDVNYMHHCNGSFYYMALQKCPL